MRGGAARRRWLAGLVAGPLVLAAACAQPSDHRLAPPAPRIATWDGDALLLAAGRMVRTGRIGVYFATDGDRYTLGAVDVTTGAELWRRGVHQHGRLRGTVEQPTVDAAGHRVYATLYDDGTRAVELGAFDLRTGAVRWRVPTAWARTTPRLCGRSSLCLPTVDAGTLVFDRATGRRRPVPSGGLERLLASGGDFQLTYDGPSRRLELGRTGDRGYERVWRATVDELFGPTIGPTVAPDGGWRGWIDPGTGAAVLSLGPALRSAAVFVSPAGHPSAVVPSVELCGSFGDRDRHLVCSRTLPPGRPARGPLGMTAMEARTTGGERLWTRVLGDEGRWGGPTPTSDPAVVALWPERARQPVLVRLGDGATPRRAPAGDLLAACEHDPPLPLGVVRLRTSGGASAHYVRLDGFTTRGLCSLRGSPIRVPAVLRRGGQVPAWFGFPPPEGSRRSGPDRWVVWVDPDGTLHGAGPARRSG